MEIDKRYKCFVCGKKGISFQCPECAEKYCKKCADREKICCSQDHESPMLEEIPTPLNY